MHNIVLVCDLVIMKLPTLSDLVRAFQGAGFLHAEQIPLPRAFELNVEVMEERKGTEGKWTEETFLRKGDYGVAIHMHMEGSLGATKTEGVTIFLFWLYDENEEEMDRLGDSQSCHLSCILLDPNHKKVTGSGDLPLHSFAFDFMDEMVQNLALFYSTVRPFTT